MDEKLAHMKPSASRGDDAPLTADKIDELMPQVPEWDLVQENDADKLRRTFTFPNFAQALDFTNRVGKIAEQEGHHPIITLTWGRATVTWYTHKIDGLHKNDFIMAAKTDERYTPE